MSKKLLLAIDVGNTNIVFAIFNGENIIRTWRIATDAKRTSDEYGIIIKGLLDNSGLNINQIVDVIISSVVPQTMFAVKGFCREYIGKKPLVVGEKKVKIGMKVDTDRPSEVGADRLVNAVAAYKLCKTAAIVIDFGTATTFDVINSKGDYIGGLIAPGINLSLDALHRAAAKLPEIAVEKPDNVIGRTTISAMQSGIYFGYLGLIEGIVAKIKKEYGKKMTVIATGGLAPLFASGTSEINILEPDLTINGLHYIYRINN